MNNDDFRLKQEANDSNKKSGKKFGVLILAFLLAVLTVLVINI